MAHRQLAMAARAVIIALVLPVLGLAAPATAAPNGEYCSTCHRGIDDAHPKKTLACTTCHRGDATATDAKKAHAEMLPNPSDLRVVDQTCGQCHQAITAKVKSSIMAHRSGTPSGTLFPNRPPPTTEGVRFAMPPSPPPAHQAGARHPVRDLPQRGLARGDELPRDDGGSARRP